MAGIGSAPGIILGVGVGAAAGAALEPAIEVPKQQAWLSAPNKVLDAATVARLVAQGGIPLDATAYDHAKRTGYDTDKLDALVYLAQAVPGAAEALFLWRLGYTDEIGYREALTKAGIRAEWQDRMVKTFSVPLTAQEVAVMVQRGVLPNEGQLPVGPPTTVGQVPPMPVVNLSAYESAQAYGTSNDQLDALTRIIGLPASPDLAARMVFRKIIDRVDFDRAIAEGNTRNEWAPFLFDGFREIPTAQQFVEAHLRGWITEQEMYDGTARHGMSQADTDVEYHIHRRPLTPHAIKQGLARGANFNPAAGEIQDPYEAAVHQNNLGPEWYELAISLAGTYPSLFITNRLVTANTITPATGKSWLEKSGLADEVVAAMYETWTGTGAAAANKDVASAETKLKTRTHSAYIAAEIDDATATAALEAAGVAAGAVPAVLALWQAERALIRKQLSPAEIVKALAKGDINAATGLAWTEPDALAALIARGYSQTEAQDLINIG